MMIFNANSIWFFWYKTSSNPEWFNGVLSDNSGTQITKTLYPSVKDTSNRVVIDGSKAVFNIPLLSLYD